MKQTRLSDHSFGVMMLMPTLVFVGCIAMYPILRILWLSFFTQNLTTGLKPEFAGFLNYVRIAHDGHLFRTIWVTCVFTFFAVGIELILGLGFAMLMHENFRGRGIARAAALIPWALPTAVLALAWTWIFNDQFGVFNDLLLRLGVLKESVAWLGNSGTAMSSVIFADVWKTTPFMMIILLAGLQNIPAELYESASIDGAPPWKCFTLITLPMLVPSLMLALLFRTLQSFGIFDLIYVMTGGGPGGATETVAIYTYSTFLRYLDFGYGAAIVVTTFVLMAAGAALIYWPLSRTSGGRNAT